MIIRNRQLVVETVGLRAAFPLWNRNTLTDIIEEELQRKKKIDPIKIIEIRFLPKLYV